jgi:hypothetical protein
LRRIQRQQQQSLDWIMQQLLPKSLKNSLNIFKWLRFFKIFAQNANYLLLG